jgi:hypothetical protein
MTRVELEKAAIWWIERFIHNAASRRFVLQYTGLDPKTIRADVRARQSQYQIHIVSDGDGTARVIPFHADAAWCSGVISQAADGSYTYTSTNATVMRGESDE